MENQKTTRIKHPVMTRNEVSLHFAIFTERIFPRIAPTDEKRRRSDEVAFEVWKNSFE